MLTTDHLENFEDVKKQSTSRWVDWMRSIDERSNRTWWSGSLWSRADRRTDHDCRGRDNVSYDEVVEIRDSRGNFAVDVS